MSRRNQSNLYDESSRPGTLYDQETTESRRLTTERPTNWENIPRDSKTNLARKSAPTQVIKRFRNVIANLFFSLFYKNLGSR